MPEPYPDDLRTRAVEKVPTGESRRSVAKELRAAASSVIERARRYSDTGSAGPSRMGTRRALKLAGCRAWILERINAFRRSRRRGCRIGFAGEASRRASPRFGASRESAASPARSRRRWRKRFQGRADPRNPVFIDETCMKTDMSLRHGRGPKGRRVRGSVPFGHWGTFCISAVLFCSRRSIAEPDAAADPRIRFAADLAERIIDASERVQALDLRGHQ